jgi:hypothetical protein
MTTAKKNPRPTARDAQKVEGEGETSLDVVIAKARDEAFTDLTPKRAFEYFKPIAMQQPTEGLTVFTGRPLVMFANVKAALELLTPALPKVLEQMRSPRLREIFELPALVMALEFATSRVPGVKLSQGEIEKLYAEAGPLRAVLLDYLTVAANPLVALVPPERVQTIREGHGKLDGAQDCVAIPGVFYEFSTALAGKHPFTTHQIERIEELGTILIQQIRPGGAAKDAATRSPESVLRDQIAAVVIERFDHLLVLASVGLGKAKADATLPALRSAVRAAVSGTIVNDPTPPTG